MRRSFAAFALAAASRAAPPADRCIFSEGAYADALLAFATAQPEHLDATAMGPYDVKQGTIDSIPGTGNPPGNGTGMAGAIAYPVPKKAGEKFPFMSFSHGAGAGRPALPVAYGVDLKTVASYGFVVVASEAGKADAAPIVLAEDQLAVITSCKADPSLHSALATADFSRVGVYGHSMGSMATLCSAGGEKSVDPAKYNIKAAVAQHACRFPGANPALISIPTMWTTASLDPICAPECSQQMFDSAQKAPSKIIFDVEGKSHGDPTLPNNPESAVTALFFSCWLRDENCDKVYGASGQEICKQIPAGTTLSTCNVTGAK